MERTLVLASTSPYRQELLKRLGLPFETASPDIDESRKEEEEPEELVMRLSLEKAKAVATDYPDALIIGSDQVATIDDEIIGSAMKALQGITVDEEHLALEVIEQVGPGGNFITADQSLHCPARH